MSNSEIISFITGMGSGIACRAFCYNSSSNKQEVRTVRFEKLHTLPQGFDLHFAPNWGTLSGDLEQITTLWIDLDAGKDKEGNYLTLDEVARKKRDWMHQIKRFALPPTCIVDTRNGLHVYWAIHATTDIESWKAIATRLVMCFGADPCSIKPKQLSRMPISTWYKRSTGLPKYEVTCTRFERVRYDLAEFSTVLPTAILEPVDRISRGRPSKHSATKREEHSLKWKESQGPFSNNKRGRKRRSLIREIIVQSKEFGENPSPTHCERHEDRRPSATLFTDGSVYCHSCGKTYTFFQRTADEMECSVIEAVLALSRKHDISVEGCKNADLAGVITRLHKNIESLPEFLDKCRPLCKNLFRKSGKSKSERLDEQNCGYDLNDPVLPLFQLMTCLHQHAGKYYDIDQLTDSLGNPMFYCSYRCIADVVGCGRDRAGNLLHVAALFGLVRPTPRPEIPEDVQMERTFDTTFLSLPDYESAEFQTMFNQRVKLLSKYVWSHSIINYDGLLELTNDKIATWVCPNDNREGHNRAVKIRKSILGIIESHLDREGFTYVKAIAVEFAHMTSIPLECATREVYHQIRILSNKYPSLRPRRVVKDDRERFDLTSEMCKSIICP